MKTNWNRKELIAKVKQFNRKVEKMDTQKYIKGSTLVELLEEYEASCYSFPMRPEKVQLRDEISKELQHRIERGLDHIGDCGALDVFNYFITGRLEV